MVCNFFLNIITSLSNQFSLFIIYHFILPHNTLEGSCGILNQNQNQELFVLNNIVKIIHMLPFETQC